MCPKVPFAEVLLTISIHRQPSSIELCTKRRVLIPSFGPAQYRNRSAKCLGEKVSEMDSRPWRKITKANKQPIRWISKYFYFLAGRAEQRCWPAFGWWVCASEVGNCSVEVAMFSQRNLVDSVCTDGLPLYNLDGHDGGRCKIEIDFPNKIPKPVFSWTCFSIKSIWAKNEGSQWRRTQKTVCDGYGTVLSCCFSAYCGIWDSQRFQFVLQLIRRPAIKVVLIDS